MKVCISSTFSDLQDYRDIALKSCEILKAKQCAMEILFSKNESPVEASLLLVQESDIYVCIIGKRYGTIKDGYTKSITHLEYEEAKKLQKPIYIFVVDVLEREKLLQVFLDEISNEHTYTVVHDLCTFRKALINTLRNNHFKDLKIDNKFIQDLESIYFKDNASHGLCMEFVSNLDSLQLIRKLEENISGLENLLNTVSLSYRELPNDLNKVLARIGCDCEKLNSIPYYENPFENRDWEMVNLGFPNWLNAIKLTFSNLKVRMLEYEMQRDNNDKIYSELSLAKEELRNFTTVVYVD